MKEQGAKKRKKRKGHTLLQRITYIIFYIFLTPYFYLCQHFRFRKNGFKVPKGPIFVISNHHTDWDGIYINSVFFPRIVHFIVHDEMFRTKALAFGSGKMLGEIKRGVNHNDIGPIIEMLKMRNAGESLGVFPEGDIDMFGRILPVQDSIAKLTKKLGMTVVLMNLTGAHLRAPRWSHYAYHSHVTYHISDVITKEELEELDVQSIYERIMKGITVDEMNWQRKVLISQHGHKRAEWLELGLFMCPKCHKLETMQSHGNTFKCYSCGYEVVLDKHSFFKSKKNKVLFECTTSWDDFQCEELRKLIKEKSEDELIASREGLSIYHCNVGEFFTKPYDICDLTISKKAIAFKTKNENHKFLFSIDEIKEFKLQYKDVLEITVGNERYRFQDFGKKWSAYMWTRILGMLKENIK